MKKRGCERRTEVAASKPSTNECMRNEAGRKEREWRRSAKRDAEVMKNLLMTEN